MKPRVFVTNFNRNFTGVSATAANVVRAQMGRYDLSLVGEALPGCPPPISLKQARAESTQPCIWHVRRNTEMRAAIWARDVLRLPIKIVFTSAAQRRHSAFPRWLISRMDAIVATTDAAADHVPNVRAVAPHGVDTAVFFPAQDRAADWAALGYGGTTGIATIGRVRPEKGTDRFVDAMIELLPQHPETVALVIGRAARKHQGFQQDLMTKVKAAGLEKRIRFVGEIAPEQLPKTMGALSLVVQLPRYEGYGMTPLEGMASGVPFVATDAGYYRSFSSQGAVGTIVDTASQAAQAAHEILTSDLHKMATLAREIAETKFGAASEADGIDAVYQEMIAQF